MEVSFNRKELLKSIDAVKLAVPTSNVLPVLKNIIIAIANDQSKLTATNLNFVIKVSLPCKSNYIGEIMIPIKEFRAFVIAVDDCENVNIKIDGKEAVISAGNHVVELQTCTDDYPPIPQFKGSYKTNILNLATQLKQIDWNMATDDSRPSLKAVHFDGENTVAADGFTLGIAPVKIEGKPKPCSLIIPREAILTIIKLKMNSVKFEADSVMARITHGNIELTTHCVLGTYPDYRQFIPQSDSNEIYVDSKSFLRSVRVVKINDDTPITKLESSETGLTIHKQVSDYNMGIQSSIEAKGDLKVAINDEYLFRVLSRCSGTISISSSSVTSPVTIKNGDNKWVIMPMYVQW